MEFLTKEFFGTEIWLWLSFVMIVLGLIVFDLGIINTKEKTMTMKRSFILSGFYIGLGLLFAIFVGQQFGKDAALNYVTGFVVEKSLAIDNVFVIAMIFSYFAIPQQLQHRVLLYGIIGVLVLRAIMIALGAVIVEQFEWVLYLFAAFLVITGVKMLFQGDGGHKLEDNKIVKWSQKIINVSPNLDGDKFFTTSKDENGKIRKIATPLFLALIIVEISDLIFAIDSIPAIFAITKDPYIVFTSNIFAILGLRALYFALASMVEKFKYLKISLAVLLIFIGSKVFVADLIGLEKFPPVISLSITGLILGLGILASIIKNQKEEQNI
ncbi:MAG: TerC family protein [Caulobacterales bacterium]|nr:TerC family protein [Caulobacterales bacterium]MCA0373099.1 TerC family protein [Pseudomonadota bacterium]